jgi:magnesium-transporting ATPase (P-type)
VTDQGILKFFAGTMGMESVRSKMLERTKEMVLTEVPFDSAFKRTTTVVLKQDGDVRVYTKGAPDVLYGKDIEMVKQKVHELQQSNPSMSDAQATANAEK